MNETLSHKTEAKLTIGMDLGDRSSQCCVLDRNGEVLEQSTVPTTQAGLRRWFAGKDPARVILEAGTHSHWVSRLLADLGHEAIVANPRMLRFIYGNDSKNDKADAVYLARVGRLGPALLKPIVHRGEAAQADRALIRSREALVRTRASLVTHARAMAKVFGSRLPRSSTGVFAHRVEAHVPDILRPALAPVLEVIATLPVKIRELDGKINALARVSYPDTALLTQVPGVGNLTALAYVLTLEDPGRFPKARVVGSYLGLRPRQSDSGDKQPQLRITKAGDTMLRYLLVECAHHMMSSRGPDTDLKRWGLALAERGGKNAKKRAAVAVARKLSVLLLRLWVTGEVYEPLRNARLRGELVPVPS
ncbi:MAG: IS110 family RNA-guided transposase [Thermoleophilia bacterium]